MAVELYRDADHVCVMFTDMMTEHESMVVQANQFLVVDHDVGAIIDPGGVLTFNELYVAMGRYFAPHKLAYIIASHADPDIIASHADPDIIAALDRWMTGTRAQVVISALWERFTPYFTKAGKTDERVIGVPDGGGALPLGESELILLPAHFMHAEGNFHFYDPVSRILFTGDLGVSLTSCAEAAQPVTDLKPHIPRMEAFHRRYMVSRKILQLWVNMVSRLDIEMLVPQHGAPIVGRAAVQDFLDWISGLECGVDLFTQANYRLPTDVIDPATRTTGPRPSPAAKVPVAAEPATGEDLQALLQRKRLQAQRAARESYEEARQDKLARMRDLALDEFKKDNL